MAQQITKDHLDQIVEFLSKKPDEFLAMIEFPNMAENKLRIQDLVSVGKHFKSLQPVNKILNEEHGWNLKKFHYESKHHLLANCDGIEIQDQKTFKKYVDGKMSDKYADIKQYYTKIEEIAKKLESIETLRFFACHYQIYMTAHLLAMSVRWRVCKALPGQGKTIIMILLSLYYIQEKGLQPVIVGQSQHLVDQL